MSRSKDEFKPLEAGTVTLYTCGHTVYGEPHIGNWLAYVRWDILLRTLKANGYDVNHVQNITDVGHLTDDEDQGEDKLQKTANSQRKTAWEIADFFIESTEKGATALNLLKPTHGPRATDYMQQQIDMVTKLESMGYTYEIPGDGIYFDTSKLKDYGKLARLDIEGLKSGARVKNNEKKNITDFALWKFSPKDSKRDMEWESPWGIGFPGWHLECSVMANDLLGDTIDIHTGGIDHIAVHHTNEIAQSETANGAVFSNYWLHANHMKIDGRKMSKSSGNIYTLDDLEKRYYDIRAFRLLVLTSHYRTQSNFTWKLMNAAQSRLKRWQAMADLRWQTTKNSKPIGDILQQSIDNANQALDDDLDTPAVLSALETSFNKLENEGLSESDREQFQDFLEFIDERLGINLLADDIDDQVKELINLRQNAREKRAFEESDELRDQILELGYRINDTSGSSIWSRV